MADPQATRLPRDTNQKKLQALKLYSIIIWGLNIPEKWSKLLYSLQQAKTHIALIQETNFQADAIHKLDNHYFPTAFHSSNTEAKSKGVTILLCKHCPLQVMDIQWDPLGRFLFIKGTLNQLPLTIANIYAPNSGQVTFFS